MQILIDTLHILKSDFLAQHHLVKGANEERIKEATVEDCQADNSANELEVIEVLWVDTRVGINLQGIIIVGGVFEETVEGVEHFVGQEEEKFTGKSLVLACNRPVKARHTEKDHRNPSHPRRRT